MLNFFNRLVTLRLREINQGSILFSFFLLILASSGFNIIKVAMMLFGVQIYKFLYPNYEMSFLHYNEFFIFF